MLCVLGFCELIIFGSARIKEGDSDYQEMFAMPRELIDATDMHQLLHLDTPGKVVRFIRRVHQDRLKNGHVCRNFETYRAEIT